MKKSTLVGILVVLVGVLLVVLVAGLAPAPLPALSPQSYGSDGTKAFVELMQNFGSPVVVDTSNTLSLPVTSSGGSGPGYVLVLSDSDSGPDGPLTGGQRSSIERWVRGGGHLVVADLHSRLASLANGPGTDATTNTNIGSIVVVNGPSIFTNDRLGKHGNATTAARLVGVGSHEPVYMVFPGTTSTGSTSLTSMLNLRTKIVLAGLALAVLLWSLSRVRRLGDPVPETPLVEVDGSIVTESMARLMRRSSNREMAEGLAADRDGVLRVLCEEPVATARAVVGADNR